MTTENLKFGDKVMSFIHIHDLNITPGEVLIVINEEKHPNDYTKTPILTFIESLGRKNREDSKYFIKCGTCISCKNYCPFTGCDMNDRDYSYRKLDNPREQSCDMWVLSKEWSKKQIELFKQSEGGK